MRNQRDQDSPGKEVLAPIDPKALILTTKRPSLVLH